MDYKELNDNELLFLISENNEDASNLLISKYRNLILLNLKEYLQEYNIIGVEVADLYQEGLIGLLQAINSFDPKRDTTFYTYANKCIKSSLLSAFRQTFRMKNRILNNSYSLDRLIENSNNNYYEILKDYRNDPDLLLSREEDENEIINRVKGRLSNNEKTIFELKLKGLSNSEIATLLDKDKKYVENTMFRINKKYKEMF